MLLTPEQSIHFQVIWLTGTRMAGVLVEQCCFENCVLLENIALIKVHIFLLEYVGWCLKSQLWPYQNQIGADIIMALDDVVKTTITGPRIEEAMYRTLRWMDRCIKGKLQSIINFFVFNTRHSIYYLVLCIVQKLKRPLLSDTSFLIANGSVGCVNLSYWSPIMMFCFHIVLTSFLTCLG